jgi:hypothetical protein
VTASELLRDIDAPAQIFASVCLEFVFRTAARTAAQRVGFGIEQRVNERIASDPRNQYVKRTFK